MNYAAPVWAAGVVIALVDWFVDGHKRFRVPTGVDADWLAAQRPVQLDAAEAEAEVKSKEN